MTKMFVVVVTLLLQLATAEYGVWSTFRYHSPGHYVIPLQASGSGYRKAAFAVKADDEFQVDVYPFKSAVPGLTRCFPDRWFMSMFSCEFPHRLPKRCFPLLNDVTPLAYGPSSNKTFWLAPIDLFTGKSAANPGEHTGGLLVIIRFNRPRRFIENTRRALSRGLVTRKAWSRLCTIRFIASTDLRPSEGSS
ncbi:Uncharacterized protein PBTT_07835 [Plasmodiophora brassicae]|uniref:Uncharacterized protein n=1 Tax=Plasmodiophora brassicae TaxID=37360 RepID=A0A0G4IUG7_PLABS|nr:hypothetical protein PBRA_006850 [Plasmodiophora brassicae]